MSTIRLQLLLTVNAIASQQTCKLLYSYIGRLGLQQLMCTIVRSRNWRDSKPPATGLNCLVAIMLNNQGSLLVPQLLYYSILKRAFPGQCPGIASEVLTSSCCTLSVPIDLRPSLILSPRTLRPTATARANHGTCLASSRLCGCTEAVATAPAAISNQNMMRQR